MFHFKRKTLWGTSGVVSYVYFIVTLYYLLLLFIFPIISTTQDILRKTLIKSLNFTVTEWPLFLEMVDRFNKYNFFIFYNSSVKGMTRFFIMKMQMIDLSITFIMEMKNTFIISVTPNNDINDAFCFSLLKLIWRCDG